MAKKAPEKQLPAVRQDASPPAFLDEAEQDAGLGSSHDAQDSLVPMASVLQPLSPQVNDRRPEYIEGAKAGQIYLKNSGLPPIDEMLFQPCYFMKSWVEWLPRDAGGGGGAGFVAQHPELPRNARSVPNPQNPKRNQFVNPENGNIYVETRYHVGFAIIGNTAMPYVIPMASAANTDSRAWTTLINNTKLPSGRSAPSWSALYRIGVRERTNNRNQSWFTWDIKHASEDPRNPQWVSKEDYARGKALYESFASGAKTMEAPPAGDEEEQAGSGATFKR